MHYYYLGHYLRDSIAKKKISLDREERGRRGRGRRRETCTGAVVTREEGTNGYLPDTSYPRSHLSHSLSPGYKLTRRATTRAMSASAFLYFRADNKAPECAPTFPTAGARGMRHPGSNELTVDAKICCWNIGDDLRLGMNRRFARGRVRKRAGERGRRGRRALSTAMLRVAR